MRSRCFETLEKRVLFSTALVLTGTTGNNTFFIRRDPATATLDAWINSATPGVGTPTKIAVISNTSSVSVSTAATNNVVTIDYTNGNPLPTTATFNGGSGVANSLTLQGLNGSSVSINGSAVSISTSIISYSTLQSITVNGSADNDTLTQTGQPSAPLIFNGGAGNDTLNIQAGTFTLVGDPSTATTNLTVNDAGSLFLTADSPGTGVNARHLTSLNISPGGTAVVDSPPSFSDRAVLMVNSLSVATGGLLDLTGNDMIVHNGAITAISSAISQGYDEANGANWKGQTGITSSLAAADATHQSAVGAILNNAAGKTIYGTGDALGAFDSQAAVLTDVLVRFTVFGDANLDGKVDGSDYSLLDNGYSHHLTGWFNGDVNYDGAIDGSDYSLTDNDFNNGSFKLSNLTYQLVNGINVAQEQSLKTIAALGPPGINYPQYVLPNGTWSEVPNTHWTVGTWAGTLWELYAATGNPYYKTQATAFTTPLSIDDTQNNDVGPRLYDSFIPLLQQEPGNQTVINILLTAAAAKATSYNATVGAFEGWRSSTSGNPAANYNVLLDLIMDSQLMFWAAKQTGNQTWYNEALSNALVESQWNVHPDGTSSQFAYFNSSNGAFVDNETYQGYNNSSNWARGEAWAIYGFNQVYQDTGNIALLNTSESVANWWIAHVPADGIPYWDFNAPSGQLYRDTSAATIAASGLLQLSKTIRTTDPVNSAKYRTAAGKILSSLVSSTYLENPAAPGDGVILHGALNVPAGIYDNPIVYSDYYFLEAVQEYLAG